MTLWLVLIQGFPVEAEMDDSPPQCESRQTRSEDLMRGVRYAMWFLVLGWLARSIARDYILSNDFIKRMLQQWQNCDTTFHAYTHYHGMLRGIGYTSLFAFLMILYLCDCSPADLEPTKH